MKKLLIATTLALLVAASVSAQSRPAAATGDARWEPLLGCWQLLDESVRNQMDLVADGGGGVPSAVQPQRRVAGTRVCVTRADKGVNMTTIVGTQTALEESVVADGVAQPMSDADCKGSKRSEWSSIGQRLYTSAEITCGSQAARKVSSLAVFMPGPTWVDIQVIDISGRKNVRIRKYQREQTEAARSRSIAPFVGESAWTVADVKEASTKLMPEAVQAALVELDATFRLSGKQLLELDDAGVADNVIDLMVALSYPKKFIVERPVTAGPTPYGMGYGLDYPVDWAESGFDSGYAMGRYSFYSDRLSFWPSYYSPFAYRYWGRYDPYDLPGSGYVIVGTPTTTPSGPVASGEGRVVDGRGYTRVSTRAPEPANRTNGDWGGTNSASSSGSSSSGNSNSGSSGVSGGGYSSGGGGSDSGRTAVPRPPGTN